MREVEGLLALQGAASEFEARLEFISNDALRHDLQIIASLTLNSTESETTCWHSLVAALEIIIKRRKLSKQISLHSMGKCF